MQLHLNIGLHSSVLGTLKSDRVLEAARSVGVFITDFHLFQSDTEPTMAAVAHCLGEHPSSILRLARHLKQDCIAVFHPATGEGELIGPNAVAWGEFDADFFTSPVGVVA